MLIVLDTNVLYQALRNSAGASNYILRLLYAGKVDLAISLSVFQEYEEVLYRASTLSDLKLSRAHIDTVLDLIGTIAQPYEKFFLLRPNLPDEDDNKFVELAVAGNCDYLITNNVRDYHRSELVFQNLHVVIPAEFVKKWRKYHEK